MALHLLAVSGADFPLAEVLNDGIVVADRDNRIVYANAAVERSPRSRTGFWTSLRRSSPRQS
jgi:hypothetical protein